MVKCDYGIHCRLLMWFAPVYPGSSPSSSPQGKSPVVWTRANQAEATFYSIRPFLLPVKFFFLEVQVRWGSLADNTPYSLFNTTYYYMNQYYKILRFLLLHNTLLILRNTTLDNTTYYYCVQYCILLHQYYVLLHFPILRITTVDNTTYYYVNTTSILLTILHITTTSNTA